MSTHLNWLKKNTHHLRIFAIEKELKMPEGTLKKWVDGNRKLPDKWASIVAEWVILFKE